MSRDMTKQEFAAACERHGFRPEFMGYYGLPCGVSANVLNAGPRRRAQLAYLIKVQTKWEKKLEAENLKH